MEFQVFFLKNSKRKFITYLILITLFCFFVTSIPVNAGLFGEKIKKISDYELKEVIKAELNLSKDPNFHSYTDSMLKEALDKEINSQETPGLTFGSFILNALYEKKLVEMCYPNFNDEKSSLFFSKLADNLSNWQDDFASKTTKLALQGVIEAYLKMPKLGIGTSTLFLAIDLVQINVAMAKLAEVIARKALFYYLFNRSQGDSHETAWGEGIPPLYNNWQTESFFQSLWNKYGEAILSDNLNGFKEQQHEILRVLILQALNRPPNPPTNMIQFKSDGKTILKIGKTTTEKTVILKAKINDPDGNKIKLQIELRRLDEYEGKFDEEKGGLQQSDLFENNSEIMVPIYGLADGDYHWQARAIDEHGIVSKWVSFGGNSDSAVDFTVGQEVVAPVITSLLKITPAPPYYVGDTINAEFSITNKGATSFNFSVLTVGGRDPDNHVSDFTHRQNITLEPSEPYNYQGTITLNKVGNYHFFCAYQTPDGNWNTNVDLGSGLVDEDRTEDISVEEKEKPSIVPDISEEVNIEWDRSFEITDYQTQLKILENGDILVNEIFEYNFDGDFNGIIRTIGIKGSDGLQYFNASEYFPIDKELDYDQSIKGDMVTYKIYDKSSNERKLFLLEYQLKNVITLYNDTAEFYWKFFDESNTSPIRHVKIEVELPGEVSKEDLKVFGHGPLDGEVSIHEDGKIVYEVFRLSSGEMVEARILFPTSLIPNSHKIINENKFAEIMEEESGSIEALEEEITAVEAVEDKTEKEKLLIDSSLYHFEYSVPRPCGKRARLPVSVSGPADELALILTNPKGETDIKFISKRALIDNFETVELGMGEEPFSEGPYILTVKTVTPEKVIYKTELWFTVPKDIKITSGEVTLRFSGSHTYTITETRLTLKNDGDLPFFIDGVKIVFTIPGKRFYGGLKEEFVFRPWHPIPLSVPSGEFKLDGSGGATWFSYDGPSDKIDAMTRLYKNGKVFLTFPMKLIIKK